MLSRHGYQVVTADCASAAFAVLTRDVIHLILSDVHMPGLQGPELIAMLRDHDVKIPVVFMSGDLALANVERALLVRDAAFLPKPFTSDQLIEAVAASVRATR
jgi:DNA-binding NtrC family response regulator